ncbi:MAG TPA: arginine--tRNA ligase, partial [Bacteroidia bacterium]|nr:arginine--tRNA ligase [Bacteroidia bacterium]
QNEWITSFETVKGFLNITIDATLYMHELNSDELLIEKNNVDVNPVVVEYSSPNTNKPLHLGHIRNNLLGYSLAKIIEAAGNKVAKVNIVNDRGIHICKSMLAWQLFGNGETPQSSGLKGDKLVGKYYVEFDKKYNEEAKQLLQQWNENKFDNSNNSIDVKAKVEILKQNIVNATKPEAKEKAETELKDFAKANTTIFKQVQQMLRSWEAGDEATIALWKTMNGWVYDGFAITYKNLGVDFEKIYYESETYLLGKKIVEEGLQKNIFYKKEDGSVWKASTINCFCVAMAHRFISRKIWERHTYVTMIFCLAE